MRRFLALLGALIITAAVIVGCGGGTQKPSPKPASSCPKQLTAKTPKNVRRHCEGWATHAVPAPPGARKLGGEQTVEMQDTITLGTITGHPYAVAGYVGGSWPTYWDLLNAHYSWNPRIVSIPVFASLNGECLDAEPGDASPGQVGGWVRRQQSLGHWKPCVYSSVSEMYSIRGNLDAYHIGRGEVRLWCAHYTYRPHLEGDCDAVQWTDHAYGKNLDESMVKLSFFQGAKPTPPPGPSHADIVNHVNGKKAAKKAWQARNCGARPLDGYCPHFRRLTGAYQNWLERVAKYRHVYCWGPQVDRGQAVCTTYRPSYSAWLRAAASSRQQFWGHKCDRHPPAGASRRMCDIWAQRTAWANAKSQHTKSVSDRGPYWVTI